MLSLDIDLTPLWDGINQFFPVFFGILAIPAGLFLALLLARLIIGEFRKAFGGGG